MGITKSFVHPSADIMGHAETTKKADELTESQPGNEVPQFFQNICVLLTSNGQHILYEGIVLHSIHRHGPHFRIVSLFFFCHGGFQVFTRVNANDVKNQPFEVNRAVMIGGFKVYELGGGQQADCDRRQSSSAFCNFPIVMC